MKYQMYRVLNDGRHRVLIGGAAAYCIANISWWLQPALINEVLLRLHLGDASAGLVASAEMAAMAFSSMILARQVRKLSFRLLAGIGAIIAIIGNLFSSFITNYPDLLMMRCLVGLGEGAALAVSSACFADFENPDGAYANVGVINILLGTILVFIFPFMGSVLTKNNIIFPFMSIIVFILSIFIYFLPKKNSYNNNLSSVVIPAHHIFSWKLMRLVMATFTVVVTSGAMWSFYYILGEKAGLSNASINNAITLAVFLSLIGGGLASFCGTRFGRLKPVSCGMLCISTAIVLMSLCSNGAIFRLSACINVAGIYFLIPYFFGYAAAQDSTGRDAAVVGGAFLLTGAVGPYLGGIIIENFGIIAMAILVPITNILAWLLFFSVSKKKYMRRKELFTQQC
ncbi:MFS transporter [Acetobacter senegalensis]|uniref:MFS transporter n=1 Tax=Acetobacter senegalensis TaxID=446692 RepID=UPI001EDAD97C|nr:MFS transporter [Acetobacter senegalensis]MCG4262429.1 MFS transporter [Acetobacter senegalensis]